MNNVRKIAFSGIIIALYVCIIYLTQGFSFGQYQIRIATGLYALSYHMPFLVLPLGLANFISNILIGGLGIYDGIGGFIVGILTSFTIVILKNYTKNTYILLLPIAIIPTLVVPIWLSFILHIPYWLLVISISVGQIISAYTLGLLIIKLKIIDQLLSNFI